MVRIPPLWRTGAICATSLGALLVLSATSASAFQTKAAADSFDNLISLAALVEESGPAVPSGLQSVRMRVKTPHLSGYAILNFAEDREEIRFSRGTQSATFYRAGDLAYSQAPTGRWMKVNLKDFSNARPPAGNAKRQATSPARRGRVLPDRTVNGVRMGALSFEISPRDFDSLYAGPENATVTCLYDRALGQPVVCTAPNVLQLTLDRYNDSRNSVTIPNVALRAAPFTPNLISH